MTLLPALLVLGACVLAALGGDSPIKRICHCSQNIHQHEVRDLVESIILDAAGGKVQILGAYAQPCEKNVCELDLMEPKSNRSGYCVNMKQNVTAEVQVAAQACVQLRQKNVGLDASGYYYSVKLPNDKPTWLDICKSADYCNAAATLQAACYAAALMTSSVLFTLVVSHLSLTQP